MKNKNTKRILLKFLKAGFFISVFFLIAFLILRTYELKSTTAAPASIDCSTNPSIAQGVDFNSGDDLTLYGNGTCTLTNSATVNSLVVGSVGGDTTVLTHQDNSTTQIYSIDITSHTDITVYSGASINADGKGYDGGTVFSHTNGYGPGAGIYTASNAGGGAGHGGDGGNVSAGEGGGTAYCDISNPATIGSGGAVGYNGSYDGGDGGGLIILHAEGTVTIDGTITADAVAHSSQYAGGGSGGGIKISADVIAGTPSSFTAIGSNTSFTPGGGGGGCVLLEYTSTPVFDVSAIDMYGGSTGSGQYGGGGQVLIKQDGTNGDLFIENNGTEGADSSQDTVANSLTVDSITVSNEANYLVPNGESFAVTKASPFEGDGTGLLKVSGSFDYTVGSNYDNLTVSVLSGGILSNTTTINITNDGGLILGDGATVDTIMNTVNTAGTLGLDQGATFVMADLNISSGTVTLYNYSAVDALSLGDLVMTGGVLTHSDNSSAQTNVINISASSANIGAAASINADGKGYDGGKVVSHTNGYGPGAGIYGIANSFGGGAGHGGDGGDDSAGEGGGTAYCDISNPATIGSGGAVGYNGSYGGGDGGGLIILDASGTVTIDGTVTADAVTHDSNYAGGGAGGSIKISADIIAGTPTSVTATGSSVY